MSPPSDCPLHDIRAAHSFQIDGVMQNVASGKPDHEFHWLNRTKVSLSIQLRCLKWERKPHKKTKHWQLKLLV